jgi:hypothetical protein
MGRFGDEQWIELMGLFEGDWSIEEMSVVKMRRGGHGGKGVMRNV